MHEKNHVAQLPTAKNYLKYRAQKKRARRARGAVLAVLDVKAAWLDPGQARRGVILDSYLLFIIVIRAHVSCSHAHSYRNLSSCSFWVDFLGNVCKDVWGDVWHMMIGGVFGTIFATMFGMMFGTIFGAMIWKIVGARSLG